MKYLLSVSLCLIVAQSQASTLTIPNTFTPNTPARAAEVNANFTAAKTAVDDNDSRITTNDSRLDAIDALLVTMQSSIISLESTVVSQQSTITVQQGEINQLEADLAAVENNSVLALDGKLKLTTLNGYDTAEFTGVNVQVNDGSGDTHGSVNGLGNLIVGYNESPSNVPNLSKESFCSATDFFDQVACEGSGAMWSSYINTGSHNLIIGAGNSYTSYGSLIHGFGNVSKRTNSATIGGENNLVEQANSVIIGGESNIARKSGGLIGAFDGRSVLIGGENNNLRGYNGTIISGANNELYRTSNGGFDYESRISEISNNSVLALDGKLKLSTLNGYDTAEFTGVNVQVNDGSGDTEGAVNGLGNVIIGYNEQLNGTSFCSNPGIWLLSLCNDVLSNITTGSHNLVIGGDHSYTQFGGIVAGSRNVIHGEYASVLGGTGNRSVGFASSVLGGNRNFGSGNYSSISGGEFNHARGDYSSVSGGKSNWVTGDYSSIGGGEALIINGDSVWTAGTASSDILTSVVNIQSNSVLALDGLLTLSTINGYDTAEFTGVNVQVNDGSGTTDGVTNGLGNLQVGYNEAGGNAIFFCSDNAYLTQIDCTNNGGVWDKNVITGSHNFIIGMDHAYTSHGGIVAGLANVSNDRFSNVVGGWRNLAAGNTSTVSGGSYNMANGSITSISGGDSNYATGSRASVSGGQTNLAIGDYSNVSGGESNSATGSHSSASGRQNDAVGNHSVVLGGSNNTATGNQSSVTGGRNNQSTGIASSVSGGWNREALTTDSWVAGSLTENN